MRLILGPLEPDKPEHLQTGLQIADNVYCSPNGYRPIRAFDAMTPALASSFGGGATFMSSDGTVQLLAGTATNLYRFTSGLTWSSMIGGLTASRWYFTQFNDKAIAVNGSTPVDVDIAAGTAAALAGSPPSAALCATSRGFLILGQVDGQKNGLQWSGFEDATQWTAGVNQSGFKAMLTGGSITGLVGGEYCLIFQRSCITRMSYAGPPTIWQFDEISANIGCMSAGSLASAGRLVFFLSDRGFMQTDGNDVTPIGAERIDRTFLETYTQNDIDEFMFSSVDPKNHTVTWVMPGKMWIYNWLLQQWSTSTWDVRAVLSGTTAGLTLEDLDALYPSIDAMTPSLDDPEFLGGVPLFLAVNASNQIGTLKGDPLEATWQMPNMELVEGRESRISQVRPLTDATDGITIRFNARSRLGDTGSTQSFSILQDSGDIDCRVSGRYIRPEISVAADTIWSYFQGLDLHMIAGGGRR